jgi:hypothetical protein
MLAAVSRQSAPVAARSSLLFLASSRQIAADRAKARLTSSARPVQRSTRVMSASQSGAPTLPVAGAGAGAGVAGDGAAAGVVAGAAAEGLPAGVLSGARAGADEPHAAARAIGTRIHRCMSAMLSADPAGHHAPADTVSRCHRWRRAGGRRQRPAASSR